VQRNNSKLWLVPLYEGGSPCPNNKCGCRWNGIYRSFNINVGSSLDSSLETKLIAQAGSYGRQIGRLYDIVTLMLEHMDKGTKPDQGAKAVIEFRKMAALITAIKDDHKK
jgi:hypothetical protein